MDDMIASPSADEAVPGVDPLVARTREIERLNQEMLLLYNASNQLNQAATPAAQLNAISDFARQTGAVRGTLFYIDEPESDQLESAVIAAEWVVAPQVALGVGTRFHTVHLPFVQTLFSVPAQAVLIGDFATQQGIDDDSRAISDAYGQHGTVILPICNSGRWIAFVWFSWDTPCYFTDYDYRIYTALMQQAAPVIDAVRLLEETTMRTRELETANAEIDLLYRASEAINSVNTYDELIAAVASFDPEADVVTLMLWENLDWQTATYIDVVAVIDRNATPGVVQAGARYPRDNYPVAEQMIGERVWIFEDAQNDPRVDALTVQSWAAMDIRAFMGPAFYFDGKWAGGITFHSARPRKYSQREVRLFSGIGDLVKAAVKRILVQQQMDQSRRELEQANAEIDLLYRTSEAINKANTYHELLEAVAPLDTDADVLVLQLWENMDWDVATYLEVMAVVNRRSSGGGFQAGIRQPRDAYPFADHLLGERVLLFGDVQHDPRVDPVTAKTLTDFNIHAFTALGLYLDNKWVGGLAFHSARPRHYDESEARLLVGISDLVMAAIQRIASKQEMDQSRRQLETIARMSAAAASILDERELLDTITELIDGQFRDYQSAIFLFQPGHDELECANLPMFPAAISLRDATSPAAAVARSHESIIVNDIDRESRYTITRLSDRVQSLMALPMIASDQFIGILEIQSSVLHRFHDVDVRLMGTLADMMAVAIQNARLYQRAQSYAVLEERNRIARELHDSVSQALYGMALGARTARTLLDRDPARVAEPLDYVVSLAEAGLSEMRALIFELRPDTLEKEGLIEALSKQVTMIRARHGLQVQTQFCPEPSLPYPAKEAAYWIIREGLHNIVKHARATTIHLTIRYLPDSMTIMLQDDGIGFDVTADYAGHLGLHSMRERAQKIRAEFQMTSTPGSGTQLTLMIPQHKSSG